MSELKLCSYCKSVPQANTWTLHGISETRYFCPNQECPHSVRTVTLEEWQTRPIEDELNNRIAELEAEHEKVFDLVRKLRTYCIFANWDNPDTKDDFNEFDAEICKWLSEFTERER